MKAEKSGPMEVPEIAAKFDGASRDAATDRRARVEAQNGRPTTATTTTAPLLERLLNLCDKFVMKHAIHTVRSFEIVAPYTIRVCFEDGTAQTIDFQPILAGELYGPLRDVDLFNRVRIDPEARTLVWPNGADFDPATLHDWPEYECEMREMAQRWAPVQT